MDTKQQRKADRASLVNELDDDQLDEIVKFLTNQINPRSGQRYVYQTERGWKCTIVHAPKKHAQIDLSRFQFGNPFDGKKALVHLVWWRWVNHNEPIAIGSHISHLDKDGDYLECVQESKDMNESRKYCHLFGWYKPTNGEDRARCPHWENPCKGP
jgi:hypothetical protein